MIETLYPIFSKELSEINNIIYDTLKCEEDLINEIVAYLSVNSGKRIRSLLLIIIANAYKHKENKHILYSSIIELIHLATLLHDDVIDNGTMRRSKQCTHLIWGEKSSILIGDFLLVKAFKLMSESEIPEASNVLLQAVTNVVIGVTKELRCRHSIINHDTYHNIITAKTAELFGASCKIGAIIGNCPDNIVKELHKFGVLLGLIFQITDDVLDYDINCITKINKEYGNDFEEGNVTLPIILLCEALDEENRSKLQKIFSSQEKNKKDFLYISNLLLQYNINNKIQSLLDEYYLKAELLLSSAFEIDSKCFSYLKVILDYCIDRAK